MKVNYKLNKEFAQEPKRAHSTDAGSDLYMPWPSGTIHALPSGMVVKIDLGLSLEIPEGYFGLITGRSSMNKKGVICYPGIIDSHYRGEVSVILQATHPGIELNGGDRIAQLIIMPCASPEFTLQSELSETTRGNGGFGSTGK